MPAIVVAGLHKHYGETLAVDGVDLVVDTGEVFALLGPNGAGKTTTVEILEGHRHRSAGEVDVLGFDPGTAGRAFRDRIGIVLQDNSLERELTVTESVAYQAALFPKPLPVGEAIAIVGLEDKAGERVKHLSGGQQRRLELALGIVGDPDLIFLDEPTTGFDPSARRQAWELVAGLRSLGKTILLTTHYMDEAQHLADRVAVMASGKIVATGTPADLGGRDRDRVRVSFHLPDPSAAAGLLVSLGATVTGEAVTIETDSPTAVLHQLTGWALDRGIELDRIDVVRPSLEDVYLRLTGHRGNDE